MTVKRFAVVGDPVAHSRSPAMHAAAYRALGLAHTYERLHATPAELGRAVEALRAGTFDGLNLTVPHKEQGIALADELDASARAIGAGNTLVRTPAGRIVAYNTDAPALAAEIRRLAAPDRLWTSGRALVLGSGGAARAAIAALASIGVREIAVRARAFDDPSRRERFLASAPAPVQAETMRASRPSEARTIAVIQATSAGMKGADSGEVVAGAVEWLALGDDTVAIDVVYAPRDTPFLRAARARGLPSDDGLGMLARQGALAFELWLGMPAPFEAMLEALTSPGSR